MKNPIESIGKSLAQAQVDIMLSLGVMLGIVKIKTKKMKRDAIIVLCHHLDDLTEEHKKRLDAGISLFNEDKADRIIVHGPNTKKYLIKQGIPEERIFTCDKSKTTIGEAYFIKEEILLMNNFKRLFVVSSDYHIRYRVPLIFDFILGKDFDTKYIEVESGKLHDSAIFWNELKSTSYAINLFNNGSIEEYIKNENRIT